MARIECATYEYIRSAPISSGLDRSVRRFKAANGKMYKIIHTASRVLLARISFQTLIIIAIALRALPQGRRLPGEKPMMRPDEARSHHPVALSAD